MKRFCLLIIIALFLGLSCFDQTKPKSVMLVLGSDNPDILANRVKIAMRLYRTRKIDKIIVSGGCAAHASNICEASEMKSQLVADGVLQNIIYKEENSKTTVQNYIFSRVLKDEKGQQIIQKNDSLYVVSDHWHAIAVAARFNKYDSVHAKFFIEGDLMPKPTDMLDYGGLFNKEVDNNTFILKGTWPTPDAVFSQNGYTEYLFADRFYSVHNNDLNESTVNGIEKFKPTLPTHWTSIDAIAKDEKKQRLLLFGQQECQIFSTKKNNAPSLLRLDQLITHLPSNFKKVDASFIKDDDLYLFSESKVIIARRTDDKFKVSKVIAIQKWISNWPYAWGNGDLAAADYDTKNKVIYLYKNRQVLQINQNNNSETLPQNLMIKWQDIN